MTAALLNRVVAEEHAISVVPGIVLASSMQVGFNAV